MNANAENHGASALVIMLLIPLVGLALFSVLSSALSLSMQSYPADAPVRQAVDAPSRSTGPLSQRGGAREEKVYIDTAAVDAVSIVSTLEEAEEDAKLLLMDVYPDLQSPWNNHAIPLDVLGGIAVSQHAQKDHLDRLPVSDILKMLLVGTCSPKRWYLRCDNGRAQYIACKLPGSALWAVMFIGLGTPPAIKSRLVLSEAHLATAARNHRCAAPLQSP